MRAEWSPDRAVIELYSQHYRALVRLAALLVRDTPTAEEVVQDSFVAMHGGWQRLRDTEKALAYLRQAVVNRSRSVLRHRTVVDKNLQKAPPDMPSAEHGALVLLERSAVVAALRGLPDRQREAIVLRYYADLSEAEIADRDGDQPRRGQEPHRPRHDRPAHRPGAGMTRGRGPGPGARAAARRAAVTSAISCASPCTPRQTRSSRARTGLIPIRARILARAGVPWPQAFAISRYWLGRSKRLTAARRDQDRSASWPVRRPAGPFLGTATRPTYYGRYDRAGRDDPDGDPDR